VAAAKVSSAGSTSSARTTFGLPAIADANMAWLLVDAADVCLTGHERTMTYVELGCGEHHLAIERILDAVMSSRMMLPAAIFDRLTCWLDGYAGSPEEPRLRKMLAEIRTQQFEPVPLRTQQSECDDVRRTAAPACSISRHQPAPPALSGFAGAKHVVLQDHRPPRNADRRPSRLSVTR
jgi:hypothetical protein